MVAVVQDEEEGRGWQGWYFEVSWRRLCGKDWSWEGLGRIGLGRVWAEYFVMEEGSDCE